MVRLLLLVVLALDLGNLCAQQSFDPEKKLRHKEMSDDLYALKKKIIDSHPNPFAFITQTEFNDRYTELVKALPDTATAAEFVYYVARALEVMKDSHTGLDFNYLTAALLDHERRILPLNLISGKDGFLVEKDPRDHIEPGTKILCINNESIDDLYAKVLLYANSEGEALVSRRRVADAILPIVLSLQNKLGETVRVDVEAPDSQRVEHLDMHTMNKAYFRQRRQYQRSMEWDSIFSFKTAKEGKYAMLKIGSFSPSSSKKFRKFIKSAFKDMSAFCTSDLVIDLRDNGGGSSSNVEYLYSFLKEAGHNTPSNVILKSSELSRSRQKMFDSGLVRAYFKLFHGRDENVKSFLHLYDLPFGELDTSYYHDREVQPLKRVFMGDVYLIINGLTASAAVDFTNTFKKEKRGVVVGEPCMGPVSGTFGNPASYKLENSGIRVFIATIRYNYDNTFIYESHAIQPDYYIETKLSDLAKGKDTQLEFIESMMLQKK